MCSHPALPCTAQLDSRTARQLDMERTISCWMKIRPADPTSLLLPSAQC